jgi:hypothetical protein
MIIQSKYFWSKKKSDRKCSLFNYLKITRALLIAKIEQIFNKILSQNFEIHFLRITWFKNFSKLLKISLDFLKKIAGFLNNFLLENCFKLKTFRFVLDVL